MKKQTISIDSTSGGNGDIWMRLVGFYAMSALIPDLTIKVLVPSFMRNLARYAFDDRLVILEDWVKMGETLTYSNLGFKDLIKNIFKGERFISPYHRSVIRDKRSRQLKDFINIILFNVSDFLGLIQVPAWNAINTYQGYLDVIGVKRLRKVDYNTFLKQLSLDYHSIYLKLNQAIPISSQLVLPADIEQHVIIFPTGTSRQFIPVWWAKKHFPQAYYAFFHKDKEAISFREQGLKTISFYHEPGDIIFLSRHSNWTISTDSFPSHLLQCSSKKCTITITEVLKKRIISPAFKGIVVDSQVECHPCLHLDRKNHPTCSAGYRECMNWKSSVYSENVVTSTQAT